MSVSLSHCSTGHRRLNHPVTLHFREYVNELFNSLDVAFALPDPETDPVSPASIQTKLYDLLRKQLDSASSCEARDVQLIMAGLTDDLFLNKEWAGLSWWRNNPIEYKLFGTRSAGDHIFTIAERLCHDSNPETAPLAQIIIDSFALGFKGRYAGDENGMPPLYLNGLHDVVHMGCSSKEDAPDRPIFAEAYKWNFTPTANKNLPALREWLLGAAVTAVFLLIISQLAWSSAIAPLDNLLNKLNL